MLSLTRNSYGMKRSIILLISAIMIFLWTVFTTYRYMIQSSELESDRINHILIDDVSNELNFNLDIQECIANSLLMGNFSTTVQNGDTLIYIKDEKLDYFHDNVYNILEEFMMINPQLSAAMFIIDPSVYPQEGGRCYAPIIEHGIPGRRNIAANLDLSKSVSYKKIISSRKSTWRLPNRKSPIYGKAIIYYIPLYKQNGDRFGLFAINVSYDILRGMLMETLPYSQEGSSITLLDDDGNVILSTRKDLKTVSTIDKEQNVIYRSKVQGTPFSIFIACSRQAIYREVYRTQRTVLYVSGIGMLLMLICCVVISRQIRHKVLRIASAEGELKMAASVQQSILKTPALHVADIDLKASIRPAREAGGDLYDYIHQDGKLIFCIGDVSGKGMPAALFMTQVVSLFRSAVAQTSIPVEIAQNINKVLANDNPQMTFCTFFVGVLDISTCQLTFCNAGHNMPIVIPAGSQATYLNVLPNIALGLIPGFQYQQETLQLTPGTQFMLYTDGANEARSATGQLYGDARLLNTASRLSPGDSPDFILHSIDRFAGTHPQSDDITVVLVRVGG